MYEYRYLTLSDDTLNVTSETEILAQIDLSDCYGAITVTLQTNRTGTTENAPVSGVSIGKMIEILSNDLFVNETQALAAKNNFALTVFGTGFGSSTLDDYKVTIFGTNCDARAVHDLSSVSYVTSHVRTNSNSSSTATEGADATLVGTDLSGCSETVYASIDLKNTAARTQRPCERSCVSATRKLSRIFVSEFDKTCH